MKLKILTEKQNTRVSNKQKKREIADYVYDQIKKEKSKNQTQQTTKKQDKQQSQLPDESQKRLENSNAILDEIGDKLDNQPGWEKSQDAIQLVLNYIDSWS